MSKHTPGPWAIEEARRVLGAGDFGRRPLRDPEVEANARLIAAAPEMLAALRGLLRVMPTLPKEAQHIQGIAKQYDDAWGAAMSAVAKAEGREP